MSDLIDDPIPGQNMPEYTVTEISGAVKRTLEDEFGLIPLIVWQDTWKELKEEMRAPFLLIEGTVSRRERTLNIVVKRAHALGLSLHEMPSRDWH